MTLLTPDDAKQQPCPFFRHCVNEDSVIQDGAGAIYIHEACKGPDCRIGWRWEPQKFQSMGKPTRGYCGAFGVQQ